MTEATKPELKTDEPVSILIDGNAYDVHPDVECEMVFLHIKILKLEAIAPQWQPIETAPKDGTIILIHGDVPWCIRVGYWGLRLLEKEYGYLPVPTVQSSQYIDRPTHWMPLPTPPNTGVE